MDGWYCTFDCCEDVIFKTMKSIHDRRPEDFKVHVDIPPMLRFNGPSKIPVDVAERQVWELTRIVADLNYRRSTNDHIMKRMKRELAGDTMLNEMKQKVARLERELESAKENEHLHYEEFLVRFSLDQEQTRARHAAEVREMEHSMRLFAMKRKEAEDENKRLRKALDEVKGVVKDSAKKIEDDLLEILTRLGV